MKLFVLLMLFLQPAQAIEPAPWQRLLFTGGNHKIMGFAPPFLHQTETLNIFY